MSQITPNETIADNLDGPKKGQNNMGMFEQHSIPDQIAGAKHLAGDQVGQAGFNKNLGMIFRAINMPGTV